jgi:hypothetical protein
MYNFPSIWLLPNGNGNERAEPSSGPVDVGSCCFPVPLEGLADVRLQAREQIQPSALAALGQRLRIARPSQAQKRLRANTPRPTVGGRKIGPEGGGGRRRCRTLGSRAAENGELIMADLYLKTDMRDNKITGLGYGRGIVVSVVQQSSGPRAREVHYTRGIVVTAIAVDRGTFNCTGRQPGTLASGRASLTRSEGRSKTA